METDVQSRATVRSTHGCAVGLQEKIGHNAETLMDVVAEQSVSIIMEAVRR